MYLNKLVLIVLLSLISSSCSVALDSIGRLAGYSPPRRLSAAGGPVVNATSLYDLKYNTYKPLFKNKYLEEVNQARLRFISSEKADSLFLSDTISVVSCYFIENSELNELWFTKDCYVSFCNTGRKFHNDIKDIISHEAVVLDSDEQMKQYAKALSRGLELVRIDFYRIKKNKFAYNKTFYYLDELFYPSVLYICNHAYEERQFQ